MGTFTRIPKSTFDNLQLDAGVILTDFDPSDVVAPSDDDILCATTGGITASCIPTYSDFGEDIDNCPSNVKELKHLDSWECKLSFTSLGSDVESIRMALGSADASGSSVTPRRDLDQDDFTSSLWWVGDRADGGCVAIEVKHALSTGGFSLQTTKSGKGQVSCEITGHVSISDQDAVPMVFYSLGGDVPSGDDTTEDDAEAEDTEPEDTDTETDTDTDTDTDADTEPDTETEPEAEEETEEDTETEDEEQVVVYTGEYGTYTYTAYALTVYALTYATSLHTGKIVSRSEVTETDAVVGVYVEGEDSGDHLVIDLSTVTDSSGYDITGDLADGEVVYSDNGNTLYAVSLGNSGATILGAIDEED